MHQIRAARVSRQRALIDHAFVLIVGANPDPGELVLVSESHGTVCLCNSHGPKLASVLQMQRRMAGIGSEQFVLLLCTSLNFLGQLIE
jgi:hypothetical protein